MARPRKPASLNKSNRYSKEEKQEMAEMEQELRGNTNKVMIPPEQLDDLAKEYYKFITKELEVADLLSNLDIPLITQTADCLSKMEQADEHINRDGILITEMDRNGNEVMKEHPMVGTKQKYLNQFKQLSTQLGMSPSSRASLAVLNLEQEKESKDPLLNLLNKHRGGEAS